MSGIDDNIGRIRVNNRPADPPASQTVEAWHICPACGTGHNLEGDPAFPPVASETCGCSCFGCRNTHEGPPASETSACQHDHTTCDRCGMGFTAMTPPIHPPASETVEVARQRLMTDIAYAVDPERYMPGDYFESHRPFIDRFGAAIRAESDARVERLREAATDVLNARGVLSSARARDRLRSAISETTEDADASTH